MLPKATLIVLLGAHAVAVHAGSGPVRLTGVVSNTAGLVIPGAEVSLHRKGANEAIAYALTDGTGAFEFLNLNPQVLDLYVEAPGFKRAVITSIEARTARTVRVPAIRLEVCDAQCKLEIEHQPDAEHAASDGKPYVYPRSKIANVSLHRFLPDGRHCGAVVYLSGSFSSSYYAPASLPNPEARFSDGWTNDEQFFLLAEAASSSNADEIEVPSRKELSDAAFSDAPSKYRGRTVIVIDRRKGEGEAKAYMRTFDRTFVDVSLRNLDDLMTSLCDARAR
jgi:Carboxypeptidase regulatory-like domain